MNVFQRATRMVRAARGRRSPIGVHEVSRLAFRVWLSDLDELRHMNNGVYLSTMDAARLHLLERAGLWQKMQAAGIYPVVVAQTISYRRSLEWRQRYAIESAVAGYDERAVYVEQRFTVGGEVYAQAVVAGRFLRRSGGVVPISELGELVGVDPAEHPIPDWMRQWAEAVRLPSTRAEAPSEWGGRAPS